MKKIITLLIFLFAGVTLAQTYTPYDKTEGRYWRAYKDALLASYVYVVNDSTSLAHLDSLVADLATSKGYLLNIKTNGDSLIVLVNSTNTKLDNVITDLDSLVLLTTNIYGAVDNVEEKLDSLDAVNTRMEANQLVSLGYQHPATKYVGLTDTVTTRTDTTTFTGTWVEGEIKADDSCEVAIDGSFPAGQTFIITETTAVKLPKWAIATSDKLFVRRYGGAGTVRFYLRLNSY